MVIDWDNVDLITGAFLYMLIWLMLMLSNKYVV